MNHDEVKELLPGYVLGALDGADRKKVDRHLRFCLKCRTTARGDRAVAEQLAFAVRLQRPPASVKALLMQRVAAEPMAAHKPRAGWRGAPRWMLAVAVVPWIAVVGLSTALAMLLQPAPAPAMKVMKVHGAHGLVGRLTMIPGQPTAFLMLTHMPTLHHGESFACWLERNGAMERVYNFGLWPRSDDTAVVFRAQHPLDSYTLLAVTMEAGAHPAHPTGTLLATTRL